MISNMQHQQFESVVMDKILPSPPSVVVDKYVNNNNNNMNKNIHIMTSNDLLTTADQDPDVIIFDPSVDYFDINSSSDTKETITIAASQSLYENAPLIRAIPITTATTNAKAATTIVMNNTKQVLDFGITTNNQMNQSTPAKSGLAKLMIGEERNIQKSILNHEYALKSPKCEKPPSELLKSQQPTSINKTYNNQQDTQQQSRQQSRSEALRCMDIHNYSKINRFDDSTNSSSPEEDDDEEDDDEDYDDDVFGATTPKLTSPKGPYANKSCDSSANKSNPLRKQSQSQINQNIHHGERAAPFEVVMCTPSHQGVPTISPMKIDTTSSSSSTTSAKSNANSPVDLPNCTSVPDDMDNGGMSGDKSAPDHHARRPMNAFLIFCKRHRAIVRDKYKNLENRQITKILGEWWATLSNIEKACYTDLAKQYKDAFFKANPNFKWYKLPAPPLRTCTIRPGPQSPTSPLTGNNYFINDNYSTSSMNGINDDEIDRFNCDNGFVRKSSTSINYSSDNTLSDNSINRHNSNNGNHSTNNSNSNLLRMANSAVGTFKLADEAQMGGLSSLMCSGSNNGSGSNSSSSASSPTENVNGIGSSDNTANGRNNTNDNNYRNRYDALQNALSETSYFLSNTMPSHKNDMEPFQHMRNHAYHMESNQMSNGKRKNLDSALDWSVKKKLFVTTEGNDYDMSPKKASRSCKGKRYKELMISGQIISTGKKGSQKVRTPTSNTTLNGYYKSFENLSETNHHQAPEQVLPRTVKTEKIETTIPDQMDTTCHNGGGQAQLDSPNSQKQFDASDFDLEEKIKALPAQCLESYLSKKRETKKKKKIGSKRRQTSSSSSVANKAHITHQNSTHIDHHSPPKTIYEARERIQCAMVGSQKRKARKESITRRDVTTINSSPVDLLSPATNTLFEAVDLVNKMAENGGVEIKVEYDIETAYNDDNMLTEMVTEIKQEEPESGPTDTVNGTPTSDLLILAEVATNHIADEGNN